MLTHTQRTTTHWRKLLLFQCAGRASCMCDWRYRGGGMEILQTNICFTLVFFVVLKKYLLGFVGLIVYISELIF